MDAHRFDAVVQHLFSRRSALGLAAVGAVLGLVRGDEATAQPKKSCPPCQGRKKGKCKPLPDGRSCGPCQECRSGRCKALCARHECGETERGFACLKACDPECDLCHFCDRVRGRCKAQCAQEFCTATGCRVPCDPKCAGDEVCVAGSCFPTCDPACGDDEGCVADAQGNKCVALAGNCPANPEGCGLEAPSCTANGGAGHCVKTTDGGSYCQSSVSCSTCTTDVDCQNLGFGLNSRCIPECESCNNSRGSACVRFAGG
jgi:hypothetical protein